MTSLQERWEKMQKQIDQLKAENNALIDEYVKLDEKHRACVQDGKDKQEEIDRLNNLINTTPPNAEAQQQIQILEYCLRQWRNLALSLSNRVNNNQPLVS